MSTIVKTKKTKAMREADRRKRLARRAARAREEAIRLAIPLEEFEQSDPSETMQLLINRTTHLYRHACAEVDRLKPGLSNNQADQEHELWPYWDEQGNLVVNHSYWVKRQDELAIFLTRLTEAAQKLGLSERRTKVKETQVSILAYALKNACDRAQIPQAQQQEIGRFLREELEAAESGKHAQVTKSTKQLPQQQTYDATATAEAA